MTPKIPINFSHEEAINNLEVLRTLAKWEGLYETIFKKEVKTPEDLRSFLIFLDSIVEREFDHLSQKQ
jgi:hypothetical protein